MEGTKEKAETQTEKNSAAVPLRGHAYVLRGAVCGDGVRPDYRRTRVYGRGKTKEYAAGNGRKKRTGWFSRPCQNRSGIG